jgi:enamine deaminase RidA (YjgF/YER057c/UK114 family)
MAKPATTDDPIDRRLGELGIALPDAPQPLGAYRAAVQAGALVFLSGQLPLRDGVVRYKGRVGAELTLEEGRAAAELTALNTLAQLRRFLGGFERLRQIVRLEGYVASAPDFFQQPKVLDAASELLRRVLGDRAGHVRSAFAVSHLPAEAAIELVVTAEVD